MLAVATARLFGPVSEITNDEKIEDCENASRDVAVTVDDIGGCEVDTCICMYAMPACEQSARARECARYEHDGALIAWKMYVRQGTV